MRLLFVLLAITLFAPTATAQDQQAGLLLMHGSGVVNAAWNADDSQILTASEAGLLQIWSADDGALQLTIEHGSSPLTHAHWLGSSAILSADESGLVRLNDAATGAALQSWQMAGKPVALEGNEAGTQALVFTDTGAGAILSLADGGTVADFAVEAQISGAAWNESEDRARAWSEAGDVYSWHLQTGEATAARPPHRGLLGGLAWNADDTRVLAWFSDGLVNLYESDGVHVGRGRISGARHNSFVQRAIWSRDESRVMSWAGDDTVHIWAADTGQRQQLLRHEDWVVGARWNADESRVLSWSHIYVYLWQDEQAQRFRHDNLVRGATWNSAGTRILSWSWDKTARVWTP
ncbi:MAG: hypothetical protein OXE95_00325 [Chloroflexi bacterium]|nr:hypothetical protein [Chloroflexota bacterium]MCY4246000.1 hypothetical protein [Chloroflexota bacterium]